MKGLVNMEYAKLGNTDIEVSELCVGCMSFGKPGTLHDWTLDESGTEEIVKHALDMGINFFDTANGYEALNDLVVSGKVRAIGASAMYGYQFYNMQLAARDNGWAQFVAMENHYNLLYREDEHELIPICRQMNVSLMPYSPLAAGHLTRPEWNSDSIRSKTDRAAMGKYDRTQEQDMEIVRRDHQLAERYGVKIQQIALAWEWAKGVTAPIIGATKASHFDDAAGAFSVKLTAVG